MLTRRTPSPHAAAAVTAAAAAAVFASDASPLGWLAGDRAARAVFGALVAEAAVRSSRRALTASATVLVLATAGARGLSVWQVLAVVLLAALLTEAIAGVRWPPLPSLAAPVMVTTVLHLTWPRPTGATAIAAAFALLPLLVSALATATPRWRVRIVALAGGAMAVAAAIGGIAAARAASARAALDAGVAATTRSADLLRNGDTTAAAARLGDASTAFSRASHQAGGPLVTAGLLVPVVSQHVRAVQALSGDARTLTSGASAILTDFASSDVAVSNGRVPIDALARLEPRIAALDRSLARTTRDVDGASSPWLLPAVRTKVATLRSHVADAAASTRSALAAVRLLPPFLGAGGERHYFLALQASSELRGTGGLIGNFAVLRVADGRGSLARVGRSDDLASPATPIEVWHEVNDAPDFPTVAADIGRLYLATAGHPIDGVIALDPTALAALLRVTGPITVTDWPTPLTADNAVPILSFQQYVALSGTPRTDFLAQVVEGVWTALTTRAVSAPDLARAFGTAARGKHIQLASLHPREEDEIRQLGVSGGLPPVRGDYLGVVTENLNANKIDWFLRRRVDYHATLDPGTATLSSTVDIVLTNTAPASGLPDYVIGDNTVPGIPRGTNRLRVAVDSPWDVIDAHVGDAPVLVSSGTAGDHRRYTLELEIPPGATRTVSLRMRGTWRHADGDYQLSLVQQAVEHADDVRVSAVAGSRKLVEREVTAPGDVVLRAAGQ